MHEMGSEQMECPYCANTMQAGALWDDTYKLRWTPASEYNDLLFSLRANIVKIGELHPSRCRGIEAFLCEKCDMLISTHVTGKQADGVKDTF